MSKALNQAVSGSSDAGWDFTCPGVLGYACGDPATGATFTSTGWPTKAVATARGQEHFDEHKLGAFIVTARRAALALGKDPNGIDVDKIAKKNNLAVMSSLDGFRAKHNLGVNSSGIAVSLEDL